MANYCGQYTAEEKAQSERLGFPVSEVKPWIPHSLRDDWQQLRKVSYS